MLGMAGMMFRTARIFPRGQQGVWWRLVKEGTRGKATAAVPVASQIPDIQAVGRSRRIDPKFEDPKVAYRSHSTKDLLRAFFVFRMCSFDVLVKNQLKLLQWCRRVMGAWLFDKVMRASVYGQFAGGVSNDEVIGVAKHYSKYGLQPMFAYTAMEVHGNAKGIVTRGDLERAWTRNYDEVVNCIDIAAESSGFAPSRPKVSTKLTFMADANLLRGLSSMVVKNSQIVAELSAKPDVAKDLASFLKHCAQTPVPSTNGYQALPDTVVREGYLPSLLTNTSFHLNFHKEFEKSGLPRTPSSEGEKLSWTEADDADLDHLWGWMLKLSKRAEDLKVCFLWDAEQTYIQNGIEVLCLDSMRRFNTQLPLLANTYQCYLRRTRDIVLRDLEISEVEGFCFSGKFVRGAYVDEEKRLSRELGYEDPVQPSYDATSENYHAIAEIMLRESKIRGSRVQMTFATHNLDTVRFILGRMEEMKATSDGDVICFAQLIGMRDYITFPLAEAGVPACKLIHYGPLEETIAHLSRRAAENTAAMPTASRERSMLRQELKRRMFNR